MKRLWPDQYPLAYNRTIPEWMMLNGFLKKKVISKAVAATFF
jgi:hypothetical protein